MHFTFHNLEAWMRSMNTHSSKALDEIHTAIPVIRTPTGGVDMDTILMAWFTKPLTPFRGQPWHIGGSLFGGLWVAFYSGNGLGSFKQDLLGVLVIKTGFRYLRGGLIFGKGKGKGNGPLNGGGGYVPQKHLSKQSWKSINFFKHTAWKKTNKQTNLDANQDIYTVGRRVKGGRAAYPQDTYLHSHLNNALTGTKS